MEERLPHSAAQRGIEAVIKGDTYDVSTPCTESPKMSSDPHGKPEDILYNSENPESNPYALNARRAWSTCKYPTLKKR
jgi:hypothetical protein